MASLEDFDFDLPEALVALRPAEPRDQARLLDATGEVLAERRVSDLDLVLRPGDLMVFNDTRVIPARLFGARLRGDSTVAVEALLIERKGEDRWLALMRPGKRLKDGDRLVFGETPDRACDLTRLEAVVAHKGEDGEILIAFDRSGPALDEAIRAIGHMPLPPYIAAKRPDDERDHADYQTMFARYEGSVAAPTAGLHFTPALMERLKARGVGQAFVTLHVGAGTFLPVKAERIEDHRMHAEWGEVSQATADLINRTRAAGGRIVAVGTTSTRLLESAAGEDGLVHPFRAPTDIFIRPGYRFRAVDVLLTNFHLPRSTLLMLLSAFAGEEKVRDAYALAVRKGYRFFSYGDASLWTRTEKA